MARRCVLLTRTVRRRLAKSHAVERAETDRAMTALRTECGRLERAIAAQERIIVYRQSLRWWLALPWLRLRLWWQRARDE